MSRKLTFIRQSEDEEIKQSGLHLDLDEIAKKGVLTSRDASVAKWYGYYKSRQPGNHMVRVVIPGGIITSTQARNLAGISERYAQGIINVTTRQALQLHWLKVGNLADIIRELESAGNSAFHGCGDVARIIPACPLADTCQYARFDVRPFAIETQEYLGSCRDLDDLPRKFKITYSGCGANCGQPHFNCGGYVATKYKGQDGFKVMIGGGLGWKAFIAEPLFGFVPKERGIDLARCIGILFKENGDRFNRAKSRLKFVVNRIGIEECRRLLLEIMKREKVDASSFIVEDIEDEGVPYPERPLVHENPQGTDKDHTVRVIIPKGELTFKDLLKLAELSEQYGDQRVYTNNRQNIELKGVRPSDVKPLKEKIEAIGYKTEGSFGLKDIVSCVGTTYCPKAVSETRALFDELAALVSEEKYKSIEKSAIINISGCPNSCSQFRVADIGYRGMRIREKSGSVEGYQIIIGGKEDNFGISLGDFKLTDCKEITRNLLDTFIKVRNENETLADCVARVGVESFKQEGYIYDKHLKPKSLSVEEGIGHTALDLKTMGLAVPCQNVCPAKTNVPRYIEAIVKGDNDLSYRINQEDNVFPGVLGRICTRVCQDECRHNWTNHHGPVQICSLKRFAADEIKEKQGPLKPRFETSNKNVAIVGGGPAGLAAARELARMGHKVKILEKSKALGGMMRHGIPAFRLPRSIIEAEVDLVLQQGVEASVNENIDSDRINNLQTEYDAVLIACGTTVSSQLRVDGDHELLEKGLSFMENFNSGELKSLEGDILVIGGGFTAVDCARSAKRITGSDAKISLVYRRTEQFMAADQLEIKALREEGIKIRTLLSPTRIEKVDGRIKVTFQRNIVKPTDNSQKPDIIPVEDRFETIICDKVISAIGQKSDLSIMPDGISIGKEFKAGPKNLFTAGDFKGDSGDVISAVASGKHAAIAIDSFLMGETRVQPAIIIKNTDQDGETGRLRDHDLQMAPVMPELPLAKRSDRDAEVELGFDKPAAQVAATRCYQCSYKMEIDSDKCIHCDWCIDAAPRKCIKKVSSISTDADGFATRYLEVDKSADTTYIYIDTNECIRCGKCVRVCPVEAISMKSLNRDAACASSKCGPKPDTV